MIEITPRAKAFIAEKLKNKRRSSIRIFVKLGGCGCRAMGLALERPKPSDAVFEIDGFTYVVDGKLLDMIAPITVNSDGIGFRLSAAGVPNIDGCGTCGFMCGGRNATRCIGDCRVCPHQCAHGQQVMHKG